MMAQPTHYKRETCRICGSDDLRQFLSLGNSPLANGFLHSEVDFLQEPFFPLVVYFCGQCSLVQLCDVISAEVLFRDYIYVTGTSDTIRLHNLEYARTVADLVNLESSDLIIEVASNDGSLLKCFQAYQVRTLGVEPATNIALLATEAGIETRNEFFNLSLSHQLLEEYGRAKAVIANNVLAHVDAPVDFLAGFKNLLTDEGLAIIEVPYLGDLLSHFEYDTIYHEHLCYFSMTALKHLAESVGLCIVRVDRKVVHGGTVRIYMGKKEIYKDHGTSAYGLIHEEQNQGMHSMQLYHLFAEKVQSNRSQIRDLLASIRQSGRSIAGYGAPAKGNTLLNYCGIETDRLPYTVDKNSLKIGTYTPGMHIPVLPVTALLEKQPDFLFILAWNFAEEIMQQQQEYSRRGGKFIIPIPEPRII